jgi:putative (di)nucleoside polyphosphate hydrolase
MPQGGIDAGETPRAAALRELHEETGVAPDRVSVEAETPDWISYDLPEHLVGRVWGGRYRGQTQKWLLARFHGTDTDIDIATAHPEFAVWAWMTPQAILATIVPFKRPVYEAVFAAFANRLGSPH